MKSTQAMRDRIRELMSREQDDYDRAVECVLDDLEGMLSAAQGQNACGDPVAWQYQAKIGWGDVWRTSDVDPYTPGFFETPDRWTVRPLYAAPAASSAQSGQVLTLLSPSNLPMENDPDVLQVARAIAEQGIGRWWDDFPETDAFGTDQGDLIEYARAAVEIFRRSAPQPPANGYTSPTPANCDWPQKPFTFHDEPGEHDPCYVVMPDGAMLSLNHHAGEGVDIARAKFIVAACNMVLSPDYPRAAVAEAMQDAWNTICSDTGCHPLDITRQGGKLFFKPGHWVDLIALFLDRSPSVPSTDREGK